MKVTKTLPISYCSGVTKAILKAKEIRNLYKDKNIYFLGNLVHNQRVVDEFKSENIKIIKYDKNNVLDKLNSLNSDDIVIFSAHGHDKYYEKILKNKGILFFDTTCDKVVKILNKIQNSSKEIIYIGKKGHPECEASLSYSNKIYLYDINSKFDYSLLKTDDPLVLNQSTLSILELQNIFDDIKQNVKNPTFEDEICNATRIRQEQILNIDKNIDLLVVVGDKTSSNTSKLYELGLKNKEITTIMVNSLNEIKEYDLSKFKNVLLTSGTSTPMVTIQEIEQYLKEL